MEQGNALVILFIVIGILFIIISFFIKEKKVKEFGLEEALLPVEPEDFSTNSIDEEEMMKEVNQKILELNDYASFIKKEINDQHKELLFLYQLITEKEKNFKQVASSSASVPIPTPVVQKDNIPPVKNEKQMTTLNDMIVERNKEIFDLYKQGHGVTAIAKTLNIGKGEVKLILDLGIR